MGGGNQVPQHFDPVFNVKPVEEQRKDPTLPQRYQSKPSKTGGLAGALIKKFINSMHDRVPDPFEDLFEMPCSVIVSGAESGDQLPHTDVSTAPDMHPPLDRHPSSCHISTFVALFPQYRINVQAGTALGEATEERWDEVLLQQGEVLVMVSTARHHGLPSPPGQQMQGALFTQWTPDRRHSGVKPNTTHLDPPTPLELKDCLGLLGWGGGEGEDVPTFGQLLLLGVGLEARVGLANRDVVDDVFSPPEVQPGPPVCTHHPLFLSRSAHGISPVTVREGEILLWNGAYEMEVVKADSTDGDAEVTWALGATLPPTRPAPAWRLLHAVPEWKRAKESKKGTWTVTCPCECEVCIVFYPVFARSSREVRNCVLCIRICSFGNLLRSSRELRANFT